MFLCRLRRKSLKAWAWSALCHNHSPTQNRGYRPLPPLPTRRASSRRALMQTFKTHGWMQQFPHLRQLWHCIPRLSPPDCTQMCNAHLQAVIQTASTQMHNMTAMKDQSTLLSSIKEHLWLVLSPPRHVIQIATAVLQTWAGVQ